MPSCYDPVRDDHVKSSRRLQRTPEYRPHDPILYDSSTFLHSPPAGSAIFDTQRFRFARYSWRELAMAQTGYDTLRTSARNQPTFEPYTPHILSRDLPHEDSPATPPRRRGRRALWVDAEVPGSSTQVHHAEPVDDSHLSIPAYAYPLLPDCNVSQFHSPGLWHDDASNDDSVQGNPDDDAPPKIIVIAPREWLPQEDIQVKRFGKWNFAVGMDDFDANGGSVEEYVAPHEGARAWPIVPLKPHPPLPDVSSFASNSSSTTRWDFMPSTFPSMVPLPPTLVYSSSSFVPCDIPSLAVHPENIDKPSLKRQHSLMNDDPQDDELWRKDGKRRRNEAIERGQDNVGRPAKRARKTLPALATSSPSQASSSPQPRENKTGKGRAQPQHPRARRQHPLRLRHERDASGQPDVVTTGYPVTSSADPAPAPLRRNLRPRKANLTYVGMC